MDFTFEGALGVVGREAKRVHGIDPYGDMLQADQEAEDGPVEATEADKPPELDDEMKEVDSFFPEGYQDMTGAGTNDR